LESQKENEMALGKLLKIDNREFLEIDQIIAEHIEPMTKRINEIIQHDKFQRKTTDEMFAFVESQSKFFKRSAYGFILASEKPGCFYLVFKHPTNRPRTDMITVHPDGFLFRQRKFRDVETLLRYFKEDEMKKMPRASSGGSGQSSASASLSGQRPRSGAPPSSANRYPNGGSSYGGGSSGSNRGGSSSYQQKNSVPRESYGGSLRDQKASSQGDSSWSNGGGTSGSVHPSRAGLVPQDDSKKGGW
jgi:transcription elongation factor SPT6